MLSSILIFSQRNIPLLVVIWPLDEGWYSHVGQKIMPECIFSVGHRECIIHFGSCHEYHLPQPPASFIFKRIKDAVQPEPVLGTLGIRSPQKGHIHVYTFTCSFTPTDNLATYMHIYTQWEKTHENFELLTVTIAQDQTRDFAPMCVCLNYMAKYPR